VPEMIFKDWPSARTDSIQDAKHGTDNL